LLVGFVLPFGRNHLVNGFARIDCGTNAEAM
jgi:hypothetical protein